MRSTRTSMGRPSGGTTNTGSSTPTGARRLGARRQLDRPRCRRKSAVHPGVHDRHHRSDARGGGDPAPEAVLRVARRDQSGGHRDDGPRRECVGLEPCRDPALRVRAGRGDRSPHRRAAVRAERAEPGSGDHTNCRRDGPRAPHRPAAAQGRRDRRRRDRPRPADHRRRAQRLLRDLPRHHRARRSTARRGRRERGEEHVPGLDEPRDPHADERDHRHERPARRHGARRGAARFRRDDPDLGRIAADDHQRHPRLLEDRGRPDRARSGAVRARAVHRGRDRRRGATGIG